MFTAGDVKRWAEEADGALRGAHVHRAWRTEDTWVLLVRFHEEGDPSQRSVSRCAVEIALAAEFARCVAVTPEWVSADDKKAKKAWGRDGHPFLTALRNHLVGCKVLGVEQLAEDRIVQIRFESSGSADSEDGVPADSEFAIRTLSVELIGRVGNLILTGASEESASPIVVKALNAGRKGRPFPAGEPYVLPPPRPGGARAEPALATDVAVSSESLAVGMASAEHQRALASDAALRSRRGVMRQALKRAVKRCQGILKKLEIQLADVGKADDYERKGNLIKANLGTLPRQAAKVTVVDYEGDEPAEVELELDGSKTVQEAMKAFYKKAKKLRSGEIHVLTRQGETDALLVELQALRDRLAEIADDDDDALDGVEAELRKRGVLPKAKASKKKPNKQQINQGPRRFVSAEGHEILVGRNDDENDKLTMRVARGRDLFFHVRGCPGSHVIMRVDVKRPPNHESLLDAAALAAYYSKARRRGTVDVSYTPRKWVKKPKGAKPGLVQISNAKTVRASGDGDRIKRVLNTLKRYED